MQTIEQSLVELVDSGRVAQEEAISKAPENVFRGYSAGAVDYRYLDYTEVKRP